MEDGISKADLEKFEIQKGDFVLLKTKNSFEDTFNFDFIYLAQDGAEYISEIRYSRELELIHLESKEAKKGIQLIKRYLQMTSLL